MSTIRQRLTKRLVLGMGLLLVLGISVAYLTARAALTRQFDAALRAKTVALASAIEQDNGEVTVDTTDPVTRDFDDAGGGNIYVVKRKDGGVVAGSSQLSGIQFSESPGTLEAPAYQNITLASGVAARAIKLVLQLQPANDNEKQAVPMEAILVVATDCRDLNRALGTLALVLAGSGFFVVVLTAGLVPLLLRREFRPLERLTNQAQRITAESLDERFPVDNLPEELAPISSRLNDLLERLQVSFERERRFSSDLAHEFRTPLAELRSLAEVSLKWPDARGEQADRNVLAIAGQLESILNRLLAIARSGQDKMPIAPERVEVAPLVSMICVSLSEQAGRRGLLIHTEVPDDLVIHSDPVLLRSILANLLENAVDYSKANSAVRITGGVDNSRFTLRICNTVDKLDAADVPRLFERFWRKDAARSGGQHAGLGLPLARAFATVLGCTLTAALEPEDRLSLTLAGPATVGPAISTAETSKQK